MTHGDAFANQPLSVRNLTFSYPGHDVLSNVSLSIDPGQAIGLLGANGAGKTTLFDLMCGLKTHHQGVFEGLPPPERIAYLTQVVTVPDALRLKELITLVLGVTQTSYSCVADMLACASEREISKFEKLLTRRGNSCSYGEKRWFVLSVMLSLPADLYILDEPTAGVDLEYQHYIWQAVDRKKQQGKKIIFSTHLAKEITDRCDAFYFLKDGETRRFESADDFITSNHATTIEQAFVEYVASRSPTQARHNG